MKVKVNKKLVDRACEVLALHDWLPQDWDIKRNESRCAMCGHFHLSDGDGGKSTRDDVRSILEEIFAKEI